MTALRGQIAVVTGASGGIGRAIARELARQGAALCLVGRDRQALTSWAASLPPGLEEIRCYRADLLVDEEIRDLANGLRSEVGRVDILVHSAGAIALGTIEKTPVDHLDWQYRTNVRAPYLLTQSLLPMIRASRGQIVFVNSSITQAPRANVGAYAATKCALKALAESLRDEVNADEVRVVSIYPGRTAGPLQAELHRIQEQPYNPELLLQPEDIAVVICQTLALPRTAEATDIHIRPFRKERKGTR